MARLPNSTRPKFTVRIAGPASVRDGAVANRPPGARATDTPARWPAKVGPEKRLPVNERTPLPAPMERAPSPTPRPANPIPPMRPLKPPMWPPKAPTQAAPRPPKLPMRPPPKMWPPPKPPWPPPKPPPRAAAARVMSGTASSSTALTATPGFNTGRTLPSLANFDFAIVGTAASDCAWPKVPDANMALSLDTVPASPPDACVTDHPLSRDSPDEPRIGVDGSDFLDWPEVQMWPARVVADQLVLHFEVAGGRLVLKQ